MTRVWAGAVVLVAILASAAVLELLGVLNNLWVNFPAPLHAVGVLAVTVALPVAVGGLWVVWKAEVGRASVIGLSILVATRVAAAILVDPELVRDPSAYDSLARGVLEGECCFGERPMGYPILLAGTYALGLSGKILNLAAGLLGGLLVWDISRRSGNKRAGVIALYLYAIAPAQILLTGVLLSETVYTTILLASLWVLATPVGGASGLLLGLSGYVRSTSIILAPAFLIPLIAKRAWRQVALFLALILLTMMPVLAATGGFSTSGLGGWLLLVGTNPESNGRYNTDDLHLYRNVWGNDRESKARDEALRRITRDPLRFAALTVRKLHVMWGTEYYGVRFALRDAGVSNRFQAPVRLLSQLFYVTVFWGAIMALWRMRHGPPMLGAVFLAIVLLVAGIHVLAEVQDRYHAYLVPLFIVLTSGLAGANENGHERT